VNAPRLERRGRTAFWSLPAWEARGLRACFFLRCGGFSRGVFRGLNLGFGSGDDPVRVRQNRGEALRAGALGPGLPVLGQQVHGHRLRVVGLRLAGRGWFEPGNALEATDGLMTCRPGLPVGVVTADCLPVLLAAWDGVRAAAAVHVGWRGLAADILHQAVGKMARQWSLDPAQIHAALGPAIGPQAFVIRGEVLEQLRALYPEALPSRERFLPAAGFDLWQAARIQLRNAGVLEKNLTMIREDTVLRPSRYYSHRRDRGRTGRMLTLIQIAAPAGGP
jgi:polyphenol oxidase